MASRSADGILFYMGCLKKQWTRIIRERLQGGIPERTSDHREQGPVPIMLTRVCSRGGRPSKGTTGLLVSDGPRLVSMGNR